MSGKLILIHQHHKRDGRKRALFLQSLGTHIKVEERYINSRESRGCCAATRAAARAMRYSARTISIKGGGERYDLRSDAVGGWVLRHQKVDSLYDRLPSLFLTHSLAALRLSIINTTSFPL